MTLNEQIVEIRYQPNAKVLDWRGRWAETMAAKLELPHWRIVDNRLDIHDKDEDRHCFISFRNAGFVAV